MISDEAIKEIGDLLDLYDERFPRGNFGTMQVPEEATSAELRLILEEAIASGVDVDMKKLGWLPGPGAVI